MKKNKLKENGFLEESDILEAIGCELTVKRYQNNKVEITEDTKIYFDILKKFHLGCYQSNPLLFSEEFYIVSFNECKICVMSEKQVVAVVSDLENTYQKKCSISKIQHFEKKISVYMNTVLQ